MKTMLKTSINLFIVMLLGFILAIPTVAMAGRNHDRHGSHNYGNSHHYDRHDRGYNQSRHYKRHKRHNSHHHYRSYNQSRGYYSRLPRYNIGYNQYPQYGYTNNYYPKQSYGYRSNVSLGINAGNTSFMLRY